MDVSIMIEGQMGLTWARWRGVAEVAEGEGFAGLYRSDHFANPAGPVQDALEMITSLTWLASHTSRIRFGVLVAPASFRDPIQLARQAVAIDELSGGRLTLGLGAGWMDREHEMFGYELGDIGTRFARLTEAIEVVTRLTSGEPASFDGRFYRLRDAHVVTSSRPRLLVGGNGEKRTLPLAARYAEEWNAVGLPPEVYAARCAVLDRLERENGRDPGAVRRSLMTGVFPGASRGDVHNPGVLCGSADEMRAHVDALEEAGCAEIMLQWLALDDLGGLRALAGALIRR